MDGTETGRRQNAGKGAAVNPTLRHKKAKDGGPSHVWQVRGRNAWWGTLRSSAGEGDRSLLAGERVAVRRFDCCRVVFGRGLLRGRFAARDLVDKGIEYPVGVAGKQVKLFQSQADPAAKFAHRRILPGWQRFEDDGKMISEPFTWSTPRICGSATKTSRNGSL